MQKTIDFFIIGAPKTGTDALRNWLNESPDAWVFGPAEPNYLCDDILGIPKDKRAWIKKVVRQARGKRLIGEKSTWYLGSQAATSEIATQFPNAKIVIMTRDNVSLYFSLHAELVKLGVEPECDPMIAWQETNADPHRLDFVNTFLPNYPVSCQIGQQIERWIDQFGHERVLIARIRELETEEGRQRMARFLGLRQFPDTAAPVANKRVSAGDSAASQPAAVIGTARSLFWMVKSVVKPLVRGVDFDRTRPPPPGGARQVAIPVTAPDFHATLAKVFAKDARLAEELMRENRNYHNRHGEVMNA